MTAGASQGSPSLWQWAIGVAVPATAAFGGLVVGSVLSSRRETSQRKYLFIERQLREFYSPLLGIRSEIRALSELRVMVHKASSETWRLNCDRYRTSPEQLARWSEEHKDEYDAEIEYNDRQFKDVLFPAYKRMVVTFRDNLWLAEAETRGHFAKLVEYVELWERVLANTIPADVKRQIDFRESKLHPLYQNLEQVHVKLQEKLRRGAA